MRGGYLRKSGDGGGSGWDWGEMRRERGRGRRFGGKGVWDWGTIVFFKGVGAAGMLEVSIDLGVLVDICMAAVRHIKFLAGLVLV